MEGNYFLYKGIKYEVIFENANLKLLKYIGNEVVSLSDSEEKEIRELLNSDTGYIYNSETLRQVVYSNQKLDNKEYLLTYLEWLENIIPEDCKLNFYNNLKSLTAKLNLDVDLSKLSSSDSFKTETSGSYNTRDNSLEMPLKTMLGVYNISRINSNPDEFFWRHYSQTLLHELTHVASSSYNAETGVALSGFDKYPPERETDKNRGLTEGFTEIISMAGVPGTIEISSGYYIEECLINQIIQLIGPQVFLKSYFGNKGTVLLEKELRKIIDNEKLAFELFRNIELNYQIKDLNTNQSILGNIQNILLYYLDRKCELLAANNEIKEINQIFDTYELMLVTPEKLSMMQKNPDNYIGLKESIARFNSIKEKYSYLLSDKNEFNR